MAIVVLCVNVGTVKVYDVELSFRVGFVSVPSVIFT